mgnify:CR=1 FL=1
MKQISTHPIAFFLALFLFVGLSPGEDAGVNLDETSNKVTLTDQPNPSDRFSCGLYDHGGIAKKSTSSGECTSKTTWKVTPEGAFECVSCLYGADGGSCHPCGGNVSSEMNPSDDLNNKKKKKN